MIFMISSSISGNKSKISISSSDSPSTTTTKAIAMISDVFNNQIWYLGYISENLLNCLNIFLAVEDKEEVSHTSTESAIEVLPC